MPTKKAWMSTASGGASPNARNAAHSTAIWNAQNAMAPSSAGSRLRRCLIASCRPAEDAAGIERELLRDPAEPAGAPGEAVQAALQVGRDEQDQRRDAHQDQRRSPPGRRVIANGASPGKMPVRRPRPQMITAAAYGK